MSLFAASDDLENTVALSELAESSGLHMSLHVPKKPMPRANERIGQTDRFCVPEGCSGRAKAVVEASKPP